MDPHSIYKALDNVAEETRMLTLSSDPSGSFIRCQLEKTDLEDGTKYYVLSHCLDDQDVDTNIIVNDVEYPVTTSLANALQQLRQLNALRIWVDTLCIDPKMEAEKSANTWKMRTTYSEAVRTYAWIGNSESDMSAISFLNSILAKQHDHQSHDHQNCSTKIDQNQQLQLQQFFKNQYWAKPSLWSELSESPNIHILCGDQVIILEDLYLALDICQKFDSWDAKTGGVFFKWLEDLLHSRNEGEDHLFCACAG